MQASAVFRLFLYLAETWGEYVKATEQNIYGTKKITLPKTECYVVFTGDRKDKPDVISLFDEFHPCAEGMIDFKVRVIFAREDSNMCECEDASTENTESMDILQQYIAFSRETDRQFKEKGRTVEALTCAIKICKCKNILREYLETREKDVIKIMTILFDQGWANEIACKEREAIGEARGEARGEYNKAVSTARNFLAMGVLSVEQIAQGTGLSVEEVAAL